MILGESTFQSVLDLIEAEGSPYCDEPPAMISVNGPSDIILEGCGHHIDATEWIDAGELEERGR